MFLKQSKQPKYVLWTLLLRLLWTLGKLYSSENTRDLYKSPFWVQGICFVEIKWIICSSANLLSKCFTFFYDSADLFLTFYKLFELFSHLIFVALSSYSSCWCFSHYTLLAKLLCQIFQVHQFFLQTFLNIFHFI